MDTLQEKLSLLQEMIAFALIDGELHDREYDFLEMVAMELEIEKPVFHQLFETLYHLISQHEMVELILHHYKNQISV